MADLEKLKRYYSQAVQTTLTARELSERDRDYYDGKQWTSSELKELANRKQPPVVINRIKPKIDNLLGIERQSRTDPKAFPRTPAHKDAAEAATDALRYVLDNTDFNEVRSETGEDLFIEGTGAAIVEVVSKRDGVEIEINHIPWDRFFFDPHSTRRDFKDAKFMGQSIWMDKEDALGFFGKEHESLLMPGTDDSSGETHDDKPKMQYFDADRDRVRVIQMFYLDKTWKMAIFTGLGSLFDGDSPYKDEDEDPINPIEAQSAFVDRDNNRYGVVRQLISVQDEINKRRSKALHLLSTRQTIREEGAVNDVAKMKRELHKPDGDIVVNKGFRFEYLDTGDMAMGQFNLLQEAKNEIDAVGSNDAVTGKDDQGSSGRALQARQQAGILELGSVLDGLRMWQKRIYRQVWYRVKQYWNEERWIRVTDDENNLKFVGLNQPITLRQKLEESGREIPPDFFDERLDQVVEVRHNVAELDVDIILEDAPDTVNIQSEQFDLLVQMFTAKPDKVPFELVIEASQLRNKDRMLEMMNGGGELTPQQQQQMEQQQLAQQRAQEIAEAKAIAATEKDRSAANLNNSKAVEVRQNAIASQLM